MSPGYSSAIGGTLDLPSQRVRIMSATPRDHQPAPATAIPAISLTSA